MAGKNIPPLPANTDRQLRTAIEKLAEATDTGAGLRGRPEDRYVRVADLLNLGLAKKLGAGAQRLASGENLVSDNAPNLTIPPQPENLEVRGGIGIIFLTWNNARAQYANHSLTEIWRSETDDIGTALMIGQTAIGFIHADGDVDYTKTYYYWVRFVSVADVAGPWNSSVGTQGQCQQDPAELLELLSGEITKSQLHQDLLEPIDLIDAPGTGLVSQIINEANSRLALAQQMRGDYTGNDPAEISTGLLHAQRLEANNSINQLASQMALLSAGGATQFDHVEIWYFDSGVEGWAGNGTPTTTTPGWIRYPDGTDPQIYSPALSVDGAKYTQVRARVRKVGTVAWDGFIVFSNTLSPIGVPRIVSTPEPDFDADGISLVTWNMGEHTEWAGHTITQIRIDAGQSSDANNYIEIDWIAIGRPAPGASSAELFEEQQARIAGQNANANAITLANAQIATKASQSALDSLSSDVSEIEGVLTAQGAKLTVLDSQLYPQAINKNCSFADWPVGQTLPTSYTSWGNVGLYKHTGQYAYSGGNAVRYVTDASTFGGFYALYQNSSIGDAQFIDVEVVFTLVSGSLSGAGVLLDWRDAGGNGFRNVFIFKDMFNESQIIGKKTVAKATLRKPLHFPVGGVVASYNCWVMSNYNADGLGALAEKEIIFDRVVLTVADASSGAIDLLTTKVAQTENELLLQSDSILQLNNDLAGKASSAALSTLTGRVTETENLIESQSISVLQLQADARGGGNLIPTDTEFSSGLGGWVGWSQVGAPFNFERDLASPTFVPDGLHQLGLASAGHPDGVFDIYYPFLPVAPSARHCFSLYISGHRSEFQIFIVWYSGVNGTYLGESSLYIGNPTDNGGSSLSSWIRTGVFGTAPANANAARLIVRMYRKPSQSNPYMWICRPMLSEVPASTTVIPPYSPSAAPATSAAIQVIAEAAANSAGEANARWEVKTTVGDLTGGVGFYNDGITTRFGINADQFFVYSPGAAGFGLTVDGGRVVMDGAYIKDATISSAAITDLSVTKLVGDTANFVKLNVGTLVVDDIQGDVDKTISAPVITGVPLPGGGFSPTVVLREVVTLNIPSQVRPRIPLIFSKARHSVSSTGSYLTRYMIMQPQSAGPAIAMTTPTTKSSDYLEWNILASNGGNNPPGWWGNVVNQSEVSWVAGGVNHYGNVSNKTISQDPAGPIDTMFTYRVYFNRVISRGATSGALGENYQLRLANNRVYQSVISEGQQASYLNAGQSTEVNAYLMSLSRTGGGASYTMCISGTGTLERLEFTALLVR